MNPRFQQQLALAQGHLDADRLEKAEAVLLLMARDQPDHPVVNDMLAAVAVRRGNSKRALYYRQRAYDADRDNAALLNALTVRLADVDQLEQAEVLLREFLVRHPDSAEAVFRLGEVLIDRRRYSAAIELADKYLADHPDHAGLIRVRGIALQRVGRAEEAMAALRRARELTPNHVPLVESLSTSLNYATDTTEQEVFSTHCHLGRLIEEHFPGPLFQHARTDDPERHLRIGLLSPDFRKHSTGYFAESILDHLPRQGFEVHCYYTSSLFDEYTDRMRTKAASFQVALSSNQRLLASRINQDRIDILIELCGLMSNHSMVAMHYKPAPVQMTAIGYPNTTGVRAIDYRIVDSITDPPGAERWAIEKLIRLDPCFLCFRFPEFLSATQPRMPDPGRPVRFGCFNSAMKVNDRLLELWAVLLKRLPDATLVIKASGLEEPEIQAVFRERVRRAGLPADRTEVLGWIKGKNNHLEMYNTVDIALDSYPYHGTTTTVEALAMGVPVVSFIGEVHRARVGLSLLTAIGQPDWCATNRDQYIETAVRLAQDRPLREQLRTTLRNRLLASPICNGPDYGARLAGALRAAWRRRCQPQGS